MGSGLYSGLSMRFNSIAAEGQPVSQLQRIDCDQTFGVLAPGLPGA
jgi:hypothetical protein